MRILILSFLTIFTTSCMQTDSSQLESQIRKSNNGMIQLDRQNNGSWNVTYEFKNPSTYYIFPRSNGDYRQSSWVSLDENTVLERHNDLDVLHLLEPEKSVTFNIQPYTQPIEQDYTPALNFGSHGIALYLGQFSLLPVDNKSELMQLDGSLQTYTGPDFNQSISLTSNLPIIAEGKIVEDSSIDLSDKMDRYIYTGPISPQKGKSFIAIIDPALPKWTQSFLSEVLDETFRSFDTKWGKQLEKPSIVLINYGRDSAFGLMTSGGAFDDMMALEIGGPELDKDSQETRQHLSWFVAHEAAHIYQFSNWLKIDSYSNGWILEGGANAMAHDVVAQSHSDPDSYLTQAYSDLFQSCVKALQDGPLVDAFNNGHYFADYACGDLIHIAIKNELNDQDIYGLWTDFLTKAGPQSSNSNLAEPFLFTANSRGVSDATIQRIRKILTESQSEPKALLTDLLTSPNSPFRFNEKGEIQYRRLSD